MKTKMKIAYLFIAFAMLTFTGCGKDGIDGVDGVDGENAAVYYSEWFAPTSWSGTSGDWYFSASAPDLTQDNVENGIVLAYVWLDGDIYNSTAIRPLPAYGVGANWSFLIHQYGSIEFTSDLIARPLTTHKFRFVVIPGTSKALKSAATKYPTQSALINMPYAEACKLFDIKDPVQVAN
jgi:hypothetical protein